MDLCKTDYDLSFVLEGSCNSCPLKAGKSRNYTIENAVPSGLCPCAYFSIIPYWISFMQGAWFRWRQNRDDVVCQCPRPQGVIFLVRRVVRQGRVTIEAEVTGPGDPPCSYQHRDGQVFLIESALCPSLFSSLWPNVDALRGPGVGNLEIECGVTPASFLIRKA